MTLVLSLAFLCFVRVTFPVTLRVYLRVSMGCLSVTRKSLERCFQVSRVSWSHYVRDFSRAQETSKVSKTQLHTISQSGCDGKGMRFNGALGEKTLKPIRI